MKLKTVEVNGKSYAEIDDKGFPIYQHDDGKEIGFDAAQAVSKIASLNGEAKSHREAKEAAETNLAKFAGKHNGANEEIILICFIEKASDKHSLVTLLLSL